MRAPLGTSRRLFIAFALLVSTFAVASSLTVAHVREIHDGLLQMRQHEEGVRLSLELASAVRDQYAHQPHTIILGNESHLPLYSAARRRVVDLTEQAKEIVDGLLDLPLHVEREPVDLRGLADEAIDRLFEENVLGLLERILGESHGVTLAPGGQRTISLIASREFDVVLTDLRLPGADGFVPALRV